jgi:hypothetical protein
LRVSPQTRHVGGSDGAAGNGAAKTGLDGEVDDDSGAEFVTEFVRDVLSTLDSPSVSEFKITGDVMDSISADEIVEAS